MKENILYDNFKVNPWDFTDAEWENSDNSPFSNFFEFDDKETKIIVRLTLIALRKKIVKSVKLGTIRDNFRSKDQEKI